MDKYDILRQFETFAPMVPAAQTLDHNNVLITSDWEIPDVDPRMVTLLRKIAKTQNIKHLVIAGDFLATDQESLTHWTATLAEDYQPTFGSVVRLAKDMLRWMLEDFETVSMIRGNHDDRVAKATKGQVHLGMFLEDLGITYSQHDHLYLTTKRGTVKVIHPRQYSGDSLKLGQRFYNVTEHNGEKCHIVIAHTHQAQLGKSPDKLRDIVALGCLRDPRRTKYLQRNSATFAGWDQGFLMIKDGYFHPIVLGQTDLSLYGISM